MKIIDGSQIETIEETMDRWVVCALHGRNIRFFIQEIKEDAFSFNPEKMPTWESNFFNLRVR